MLRSTSTTQGVIALSSAESELYALVKGRSAGVGAVSMLKDSGVNISKNTKSDKAAVEVSWRDSWTKHSSTGSIRNIATPTLRVQKLTQDGIIKIT